MGNNQSGEGSPSADGGAHQKGGGYRVFRVQENSPSHLAGLEVFFDYIVAVNGKQVSHENTVFFWEIAKLENQVCKFCIFSMKSQELREIDITPQRWAGQGLLGSTIKYDTFDTQQLNNIRVTEVFDSSPAALAGIQKNVDYFLGSSEIMFKGLEDLVEVVAGSMNQKLPLYVYNSDTEETRVVVITPNRDWGGRGSLGCEFGTGLLHKIPLPRAIRASLNPNSPQVKPESSSITSPSSIKNLDAMPQPQAEVANPIKQATQNPYQQQKQQQQNDAASQQAAVEAQKQVQSQAEYIKALEAKVAAMEAQGSPQAAAVGAVVQQVAAVAVADSNVKAGPVDASNQAETLNWNFANFGWANTSWNTSSQTIANATQHQSLTFSQQQTQQNQQQQTSVQKQQQMQNNQSQPQQLQLNQQPQPSSSFQNQQQSQQQQILISQNQNQNQQLSSMPASISSGNGNLSDNTGTAVNASTDGFQGSWTQDQPQPQPIQYQKRPWTNNEAQEIQLDTDFQFRTSKEQEIIGFDQVLEAQKSSASSASSSASNSNFNPNSSDNLNQEQQFQSLGQEQQQFQPFEWNIELELGADQKVWHQQQQVMQTAQHQQLHVQTQNGTLTT